MLKIKDNVDLKELEKYGFKPKYDEDTGKIEYVEKICGRHGWYGGTYNKLLFKRKKMRFRIEDLRVMDLSIGDIYYIEDIYETLYDLIKDGLVEKVK